MTVEENKMSEWINEQIADLWNGFEFLNCSKIYQ